MSPAYDGLSKEQRGLKDGSLVLHSCNNGVPKEATICPFCTRNNVSSEEALDFLVANKKAELQDELARLLDMQKIAEEKPVSSEV